MEFTFDTTYDQEALTAMARTLRKTVRKKRSRRSHIFGCIVFVLALILALSASEFTFSTVITFLAALAIVVALLFEDQLNGYFAGKRALPGTEKATTVFTEENYTSSTAAGKTEWQYDNIGAIAETPAYFVFIFSSSHAQVYDKRSITGGTVDSFRNFLTEKTGKTIQSI